MPNVAKSQVAPPAALTRDFRGDIDLQQIYIFTVHTLFHLPVGVLFALGKISHHWLYVELTNPKAVRGDLDIFRKQSAKIVIIGNS